MPDWRPALRARLASVSLDPTREADVLEELGAHLDERVHDLIAQGVVPEQAEARILEELQTADRLPRLFAALNQARWRATPPVGARSTWSWPALRGDARRAVRRLASHPLHTAVIVTTLALGLGANATTFAVADWLVLRPIPGVRDPARLVTIRLSTSDSGSHSPMSLADVDGVRANMPALEDVAGFVDIGGFLSVSAGLAGERPARVQAETVSANYFAVLGTSLRLGRTFTDVEGRDSSAAPVAIVSDAFFRGTLHGDGSRLGRPFVINGTPVALAGVATPGFVGTNRAQRIDLWLPVAQRAIATPARSAQPFFTLVARYRPGADLATVRHQLPAAERALTEGLPDSPRFTTHHLVAQSGLEAESVDDRQLRATVVLPMGFAGLLLVLACANVANANLAQAAARQGEIATRLALGASRRAIAQTLFLDSLIPALLAGVVALMVARAGVTLMDDTTLVVGRATLDHVQLDWRVLAVGLGLALGTALATGMWPVLVATRTPVAGVLGQQSRRHSRRQRLIRALVAAQVTLSFVLLLAAVLLVRSMAARLSVDPGFDDDHVLTFAVDPLALRGRDVGALYQQLEDRLRVLPGVRGVARTFLPPFYSGVEARLLLRPDHEARNLPVGLNDVEPGFFTAVGIPLLAGRDFTAAERDATRPAAESPLIVNESLARRLFGDRPAVGGLVTLYNGQHRQVVGVVRDARHRRLLDDNSAEMAFQPFQDNMTTPFVTFVIGFAQPADSAWPLVRRAIASVDPTLPTYAEKSARAGIRAEFAQDTLLMRLTLVFGGLALLVAALGLYSVWVRRVGERQHEFGIRAALGARPAVLARIVVAEAVVLVAVGVCIGAGLGAWLTTVIRSRLFGLSRFDPSAFVIAMTVIVATVLAASLPAARRVARTNPARTLRI
jgi:predicted permease